MLKPIIILCLLVLVYTKANQNGDRRSVKESCPRFCVGKEYECIEGYCYCAAGHIPNLTHNRCIRCPGLGQRCYGTCCDSQGNRTLTCWKGFCTICEPYEDNTWVCPDPFDHIFVISSTEIAIGSALVLAIIAIFLLILKLSSAVRNLRPLGRSTEDRLSIGSLQLYIDERLRDAPPRYSRTASSSTPTVLVPESAYMDAVLVHDSSFPPPPYTPNKDDDLHNTTNYI